MLREEGPPSRALPASTNAIQSIAIGAKPSGRLSADEPGHDLGSVAILCPASYYAIPEDADVSE